MSEISRFKAMSSKLDEVARSICSSRALLEVANQPAMVAVRGAKRTTDVVDTERWWRYKRMNSAANREQKKKSAGGRKVYR